MFRECDSEIRTGQPITTAAQTDRDRPTSVPNPFMATNLARQRLIPPLAPLALAGLPCLIESIGSTTTNL